MSLLIMFYLLTSNIVDILLPVINKYQVKFRKIPHISNHKFWQFAQQELESFFRISVYKQFAPKVIEAAMMTLDSCGVAENQARIPKIPKDLTDVSGLKELLDCDFCAPSANKKIQQQGYHLCSHCPQGRGV